MTRTRTHAHAHAHIHAHTHTRSYDCSGSTCCPSNCMKNGHEGLSSRKLGSFRDLNTMATKGCSDLQDLVLSSHTESLYFVRRQGRSNRSPGLRVKPQNASRKCDEMLCSRGSLQETPQGLQTSYQ